MTEHTQTTVDGREEPLRAAPCACYGAPGHCREYHGPPEPLFDAPQTIRGQIAMPTDP